MSDAPLSQETFEVFAKLIRIHIREFQKFLDEYKSQDHYFKKEAGNTVDEKMIGELFKQLQTLDRWPKHSMTFLHGLLEQNEETQQVHREFVARPDVELVHILRLHMLTTPKGDKTSGMNGPLDSLFRILHWSIWRIFSEAKPGQLDFSKLGDVLRKLGMDDLAPGRAYIFFGLEPEEENLPYYFDRPELLLNALTEEKGSWFLPRQKSVAFHVLQKMPKIPNDILDVVWEYALSEAKTFRLDAQAVLDPLPETFQKILEALKNSKAGTRSVAAQWLGRLRKPEAVKPLQEAMKKEKTDSTRIDIMKALVACGVSLDELLDREQLLKEAEKNVKKEVPKPLAWFPFDKMPAVHWKDGTAVDPKIVQHWLFQAVKMKTPEPNPLLVLYGEQMNRTECEAAARFVLETWIDRDTKIGSDAEIIEQLKNDPKMKPWFKMNPNATDDELKEDFEFMFGNKQPLHTATDCKGILGLVAAWGDATLPAVMEKYVRDWYGWRVHQSRALVVTMGGMENLAAIQALLSISRKMKTKSIREEAENAIRNIAERNDWTLDQLADRTTPTAGLDENRTIMYDLGVRKLTGRWETEPKLFLYDENGKKLKAFPGQLKSDDETLYVEAKKAFQAANRLLKTTVTQQMERLYEAMCAGRTWTFGEWSTFILHHPILGRLASGLVWGVFDKDDSEIPSEIFRPLEDGSLTDVNDNSVTLAETDRVRIVHPLNLSAEQIAAWTEHLKDYKVKPLFQQFGRVPYRLPDEKKRETKITDFYESKVMAFTLRSTATKLGFVRGETGDGGWFHDYIKPMPGLEQVVAIEFSGNGLPEENNEIELYHLVFRTKQGRELPLGKVPPVLLSEMYRSFETIAKSGKPGT